MKILKISTYAVFVFQSIHSSESVAGESLLMDTSAIPSESDFLQDYKKELLLTQAYRSLEKENAHKSTTSFMGWQENQDLIQRLDNNEKLDLNPFLASEKSNKGFYYWTIFRNTYGSLFAFACATGQQQLAYVLWEKGVDINKISIPLNGIFSTPLLLLMTAPYRFNGPKKQLDLMQFLLEHGAFIHYLGHKNDTVISLLSLLAFEDLVIVSDIKKNIITFMQKEYGSRQFLIKYLADIQLSQQDSLSSRKKITAHLISEKVFKKADIQELLKYESDIHHIPANIVDIFKQYGYRNTLLEEHIPLGDIVDIIIVYLGDSIYQIDPKSPALTLPISVDTNTIKKRGADCCTIF